MASLMPSGRQQYFDSNGNPLAGGKVYTYSAGTSTPLATYSDQAGTTPNANPIILDARGEAPIFWGLAPYKVVLKTSADATVWTQDNMYAQADSQSVATELALRLPEIGTYAALRAYSGAQTAYYVRGVANIFDGGAGVFRVDSADTTSADNGGTILLDAAGRRWKREYDIDIFPEWFGAVADGVTDDSLAIIRSLARPGVVKLRAKKYAIGSEVVISRLYSRLEGANLASSQSMDGVTVLKWIGASGGIMVRVPASMHGPQFKNIAFDCNNLANIGLHIDAGTGQSIQFPTLEKLEFRGYLRAGLVLGANDTATLQNGQLQMCSLRDITWMGAGASAPAGAVYGMVLNAQNCEVAVCSNLYFDPFTAVGGGPYINHQNHILVVSGGLNIVGMTGTRSTGYAIEVVNECGLIVDQYRAEDILLINFPNTSGTPSNPIRLSNIDHRSGLASGSDDAIVLRYAGDMPAMVENCRITGNIKLGANVAKTVRLSEIKYRAGTSVTGATVVLGPIVGNLSLEETLGARTVYNTTAKEEWRSNDGANTLLYKNDAGKLAKVRSISGSGTAAENLGGVVTVSGTATSQLFTFPVAEPDGSYRIVATPIATTGTPAAGSNSITKIDRTTTGFTINVEVAPGTSNSVTFAWFLFRA